MAERAVETGPRLAAVKTLEGVTVLTSPAAAFENEAVVTTLSDNTAVPA
jgi:hypothetical protein